MSLDYMTQPHFHLVESILYNRLSPFFTYTEEQSLLRILYGEEIYGEELDRLIIDLFTYLFRLWNIRHNDVNDVIDTLRLISDALHNIRGKLLTDLNHQTLLDTLPLDRLNDLIADVDDVYMIIRKPYRELRNYQSLQELIYYRLSPNTRRRMSAYKPVRRRRTNSQ